MQNLCNSKALTLKIIKNKLFDINKIFTDTLCLLNCDFSNPYFGTLYLTKSIFNQLSFIKMKGVTSNFLEFVKELWITTKFEKVKKLKNKKEEFKTKSNYSKEQLNNEIKIIKISQGFENLKKHAKIKANLRSKIYLNKIKYTDTDLQYNETYCPDIAKFHTAHPPKNTPKEMPFEEDNFDSIELDSESIARINKNTETYLRNRKRGNTFHQTNGNDRQLQIFNTTPGNIKSNNNYKKSNFSNAYEKTESNINQTGNVDLLGLDLSTPNDNNKSVQEIKNHHDNNRIDFDLDLTTIARINQNVKNMNNKMKYNKDILNKSSYDDFYLQDISPHFHSTPGNIQNNNKIHNLFQTNNNFNSFSNNAGKLNIDILDQNSNMMKNTIESYNSKPTYLHTTTTQTIPYQNKTDNSSMQGTLDISKFNTISTPYSQIPTYPSLNTNPNNNTNIPTQNNLSANLKQNVPNNQINNPINISNFHTTSFSNNNHPQMGMNNPNIIPNNNYQEMKYSSTGYPSSSSNINPIYHQITDVIHQGNNPFSSSQKFSQDDMSFLSGTTQTQKKELSTEDILQIKKINPEIYAELRERVLFTFHPDKRLKKMECKGYIGIGFQQGFKINKKSFSLSILQNNWKDESQYQNKDINQTIMHKVTETNYNIKLKNQSSSIKLLTYSNNQRTLYNNNYIQFSCVFPGISSIALKFNHNAHLLKSEYIYKTSFHLCLRSNININIRERTNQAKIKFEKGEIQIEFQKFMNECSLDLYTGNNSLNINSGLIYKICVKFEMKNCIVSDNNIRLTYKNSVEHQDELLITKLALIGFEYEL